MYDGRSESKLRPASPCGVGLQSSDFCILPCCWEPVPKSHQTLVPPQRLWAGGLHRKASAPPQHLHCHPQSPQRSSSHVLLPAAPSTYPAVALALRVDYMVEDEVPRVCLAAPAVHGPFCNLNFQTLLFYTCVPSDLKAWPLHRKMGCVDAKEQEQ